MNSSSERPRGPLSRRGLIFGGMVAGATALSAAAPVGSTSSGARPQPVSGRALGTRAESAYTPATSPGATRSVPAHADPPPAAAIPDPAGLRANELGVVPVMMYHRVQSRITGEYDMTPADFREQLRRLFSMGMRPVRTIDLVRCDFPIRAGRTPVVLTFDDGYPNQFAVDDAGNVDPATAVGILMDVCREFPDCVPAGSLNVNKDPFGLTSAAGQRRGLARLLELGFEIGNHTFNHDDLRRLDAVGVREDLVKLQRLVEHAVPGASVRTMALPFGVEPHRRALLPSGSWNGEAYRNEGVLLVGANPSASPFHASFDPMAIPRIRGTSWDHGSAPLTARYWISYLKAHRDRLYVAAGNPGAVTAPKALARGAAPRYRHRLVTY